ncbi:immunoglobulin-like domain-containing protein, partial [Clostridium perfringens]
KPEILGEDLAYPIGTKINLMEGITANDIEDGDLTSQVEIKSSDFVEGKSGVFTIVYTVTDSDGLTSEFSRFIA